MAASLLPCPPSSNNYRMGQLCLHMHPDQLQKSIMCLSVHIQSKACNRKLYMIPGGAISDRHVLRTSASAGSIELDSTHQGNEASFSVWGPNDPQGSKKLLDCSRNPLEDTTDFEGQLQELFDEVKTMIKMGNENDAIDLLRANYEAVKEQMDSGARGIEQAATLDVIALGYIAIGDLKMVGSLLDVLDEVVDGLKDDELLLDSVLTHMGSMYSALGKFEDSMLAYRRSLEILEREYGKNSVFLITPLLGMAKVLGSIRRATKAVEVYHRVITIFELSKGAESEDLVVPLLGLGNLLMKEGKAMDAEIPFMRILNIYTKLYGENDGRVGKAMCSLAKVKFAKGNADEAIQLYINALQVLKDSKGMPLDDNVMEKMRIEVAELLHLVGRGKEGRKLLEECLFITEKYKGKEHPSLVTYLVNLATSFSCSKNFVEAERLLRRSLQIMLKTVGPNDQSITFPMLNLAVTLHNLNQHEEAEQVAVEVLRIREKAFGKESLPVGEALDCLVSIQSKLGKDDIELLELLKRVLAIQEKGFGSESEEVMQTLNKIVFYLDKMGMRDEKFPMQRRLSMLRTKYKHMVQY
ncbi:nephrocystin-3 isoform X2 [Camellia sinensis]|uniref:nephrocystin-3 isoform X2 n=1 Tax=Camellia sinensis TaxID=4442 RepID=UPI001036D3C3|nr:nephrocystin-3 isoform X2 [Camellia sinensis]